MGINIGGFVIPTSAGELGADTRNDAIDTAKTIAAPFYNGGAAIGGAAADFVHGLVTGHALASSAAPAPAPKAAAAPAKGAQAAAKPVSPMDAFLAAQMARQSQPGYGADSAAPAGPMDVIRNAAVANGGLTLNQLGALSEAITRANPPQAPKQRTYRDLAAQQALDLTTAAANKEMADAKASNDPVAYRSATDRAIARLGIIGGAPDQSFQLTQMGNYNPSGNQ